MVDVLLFLEFWWKKRKNLKDDAPLLDPGLIQVCGCGCYFYSVLVAFLLQKSSKFLLVWLVAKQHCDFWGEGYVLLSAEEMPLLRANEAVTLLCCYFFTNVGKQTFSKTKHWWAGSWVKLTRIINREQVLPKTGKSVSFLQPSLWMLWALLKSVILVRCLVCCARCGLLLLKRS